MPNNSWNNGSGPLGPNVRGAKELMANTRRGRDKHTSGNNMRNGPLRPNNITWRNAQRKKRENNLRNPGLFNKFKKMFQSPKNRLFGQKNVRVTNF